MKKYNASSTNSRNFILKEDNIKTGELIYSQWYSFKAEISLADNSVYQLEPKGFWDSKIELKNRENILLDFEMGWKGIVINFHENNTKYLLKLRGLLSSKFILVDTDGNELLAIDTDFRWTKLNLDFHIETSEEFDQFHNKEILLLTTIHCVNYYMAFVSSTI